MNTNCTIEFFFDYLSPYAYVAWTQIHSLARRFHLEVQPVPILLGVLLNTTGQKGPAEVPFERIYIFKDISRTTRALGMPFALPPSHPFNPLLPLRASCLPMDLELKKKLVTLLFEAAWAHGQDITQKDDVARVADLAGLNGKDLVELAQSEEAKSQLRTNTSLAISEGMFGVPTMRISGEIFWGYESFSNLERFLSTGQNDVDPVLLERWRNLKPSAQRLPTNKS